MAYSEITDAEIEPGKPGSNALFIKVRDNPIAIANGDSGAPQVQNAAIADESVTNPKLGADAVTGDKILADVITFAKHINKTLQVGGIWTLVPGAPFIVPPGVYNVSHLDSAELEYLINTIWQAPSAQMSLYQIVSDGVSLRFVTSTSNTMVSYTTIIT